MEKIHLLLDLGGIIPFVGIPFDIVHAGLYAYEGRWGMALLSGISAIPGFGDAVGVVKFGKYYKAATTCAEAAEGAGKFFKNVRTAERIANGIQSTVGFAQGGYDAYQNGLNRSNVFPMGVGLLGASMAARSTQLPCFVAGTLVSTPQGRRRSRRSFPGIGCAGMICGRASGGTVWSRTTRRWRMMI